MGARVWKGALTPGEKARSEARGSKLLGRWDAEGDRSGSLETTGREKPLASLVLTVPETDTGRRGEDPKARERTPVKELGKLTP